MTTYKLHKSDRNGHVFFMQTENGWVRSKIDFTLMFGKDEAEGLFQSVNNAVEVVRCKDCKHFDHDDFGKGEEYWCKHFVSTDDTSHCHTVTEDDFCAWGERKEDG